MSTSSMPCCHICGTELILRPTKGRKTGKVGVMFICPNDGRHFRCFITDKQYVARVLGLQEGDGGNSQSEKASGNRPESEEGPDR